MEQIEPLDAELAAARRRARGARRRGGAALRAQIAEDEVAIDAELEQRAGRAGDARRRRSSPSCSPSTRRCARSPAASPSPGSSAAPAAAATSACPRSRSTASRSSRPTRRRTARSAAASSPAERDRAPLVRRAVDPHRVGGVPEPGGRLPAGRARQRCSRWSSCPSASPGCCTAWPARPCVLAVVMVGARGRRLVQRRLLGAAHRHAPAPRARRRLGRHPAFWWPFLGIGVVDRRAARARPGRRSNVVLELRRRRRRAGGPTGASGSTSPSAGPRSSAPVGSAATSCPVRPPC